MAFRHLSSARRMLEKRLLISAAASSPMTRSSPVPCFHKFDRTEDYSSAPAGSAAEFMRGMVFWEANKPLTIEEFRMPRPKAGEVLIKTKACGVCHSDLHVLKGHIQFTSPCVVGHEITGEVVEHAALSDPKIVKRFPIGARVIGSFIMPCGNCFYCDKGHDDLCEDYFAHNRAHGTLYDGTTRLYLRDSGRPIYMFSMGGMAEYCVVPAHALAVLPESLPYSESSILGCAVFTAYGAMAHAAEVRAGDSVAVIGIGGVGSSCLQLAKAFGASEIIAVDIQDDKLEKAKTFGATHTINSKKENASERIREITGGRGADIAVEALGNPKTFAQCTQSVRDGGKAVMIGIANVGEVGEINIIHLVRRKIKVIGSYGGRARTDLPKLVKLAETGTFSLSNAVSRKYKFEEVNEALEDLHQGKILGRAVVEIM